MMTFTLGERSKQRLVGVNQQLVRVVERAIVLTKQDFSVIEGLRSMERQRQLVAQGKSQTLNSKHITGHAVDLAAYSGGQISWKLEQYDEIADAMAQAARDVGVGVRWGAAWNIPDIRRWDGSMESAMNHYIDERRRQGKRPFIDAPHFELA
jgi:peptidoglycan L-alanyl-D-glutamate endopeptidase CwlK